MPVRRIPSGETLDLNITSDTRTDDVTEEATTSRAGQVDAHSVPVDAIAATYDHRMLGERSDAELVAAVADVVSIPRSAPADSFVLHAPLELMARSQLLPLVAPSARRSARLHLLAIAARYEAFGDPIPPSPDDAEVDADGWLDELVLGIETGRLDLVDRAALGLETEPVDPAVLIGQLAPVVIARTSAAAHGSIYLALLGEIGSSARDFTSLFHPLGRELARNPDWRIGWIDRSSHVGGEPDPTALFEALATAPRLGLPGSSFIHPIMMQVDGDGPAAALLQRFTGAPITTAAVQSVLRVAALSMVRDTPEHAAYGWTHCLTLPQAVLALSRHLGADDTGLAIAATHVLGFRAALGTVDLAIDDELVRPLPPEELRARIASLATNAATRHDAHIVKYALAVITAARTDPSAADLYLSAGEHLLMTWDRNGGHPADHLR